VTSIPRDDYLRAPSKLVLTLLMLTYMTNIIDRQVMSILLEPIKHDLQISDTYLGLLTGFSFALFHAVVGIPIARLSDRHSRRDIISVSLLFFSAMTLVCGMVVNFWQLVLARIGVGVGEAGTSPASHSMIADMYPPEKRTGAMAIYSTGQNLGTMLAFFFAGWIAHFYGWRTAFVVVALPGIVLALVVRLFLREPVRGHSDGFSGETGKVGFLEALRCLWAIPSLRHIIFGVALAGFSWYGISSWSPSFLARSFHMTLGQIGTALALLVGLGGAIGLLGTGLLLNRLGRIDIRWNMWALTIIMTVSFPFAIGLYLSHSAVLALAMLVVPAVFATAQFAPTLAMTQALSPVPMRALASAVYLLLGNLIGHGLGPQVIGILSDLYRPAFGQESLRYAMLSVTVVYPWAGLHFYLASRTLKADLARLRQGNEPAIGQTDTEMRNA
jgi:predicted MFS family arabinose efflux permease